MCFHVKTEMMSHGGRVGDVKYDRYRLFCGSWILRIIEWSNINVRVKEVVISMHTDSWLLFYCISLLTLEWQNFINTLIWYPEGDSWGRDRQPLQILLCHSDQ